MILLRALTIIHLIHVHVLGKNVLWYMYIYITIVAWFISFITFSCINYIFLSLYVYIYFHIFHVQLYITNKHL